MDTKKWAVLVIKEVFSAPSADNFRDVSYQFKLQTKEGDARAVFQYHAGHKLYTKTPVPAAFHNIVLEHYSILTAICKGMSTNQYKNFHALYLGTCK